MKSRILVLALLAMMLLPMAASAMPTPRAEPVRGPLLVGPGHYGSIRAALDAARDGDVIRLQPGIYSEPVTVDKQVTLMGTGVTQTTLMEVAANNVTVTGIDFTGIRNDTNEHSWDWAGVITRQTSGAAIDNSMVSDLRIQNCTFTNSKQGVFLFGAKKSVVQDCTFTGNTRGITIRGHYTDTNLSWSSFGNTIKGCTFINQAPQGGCDGEAIAIHSSDGNTIQDCVMDGNAWGVFVESSSGTTIKGCSIKGCTIALANSTGSTLTGNNFDATTSAPSLSIVGTAMGQYNHAIDATNKIGGRPILYHYNEADLSIASQTAASVMLAYCPSARITDTTVRDGDGVWLFQSNSVQLSHVNVSNTIWGLGLVVANNCAIGGSTVDTGTRGDYGVSLFASTGTTARDTVIRTPNGVLAWKLLGASTVSAYNTTFDATKVSTLGAGNGGVLRLYSTLTIVIQDKSTKKGIGNAEVNLTQSGVPIYRTAHFGGSDLVTDATGHIKPLDLLAKEWNRTDTVAVKTYDLVAWAKKDATWTETRTGVDMSTSHQEVFKATIRKERSPGFGGEAMVAAVLAVACLLAAARRRR
jgi:parallel beta-helix repeat protein